MKSDQAYGYAFDHADRNPDGSIVESSLVTLLAEQIDFDPDKARLGLAQRVVARRKRPGQTAPEGSIVIPGLEHYAYEPHRLLADDGGNIIENQHAPVKFKVAVAGRAQADAQRAFDTAAREQTEMGHFAVWAADQLADGRPPHEVTWDACVRETGLWKDDEAQPESNVDLDEDES